MAAGFASWVARAAGWLPVVLALAMVATSSRADTVRDPEEFFFHTSFGDLTEEIDIARDEGKFGVLVMFESNDCPWCRRMKETVLNQARVQDLYRRNFQILSINTEGDGALVGFDGAEVLEKEFALRHNRVRATPVFAFFDLEGAFVARLTGATRDADEFLWLAEFVVDGHYRTQKWPKYRRARRLETS